MANEPTTQHWSESYRQHATNLRNWFLAYGIGGPVLLLGNEKIWDKFAAAPNAKYISWLFIAGIALQVVLAIVDKYTSWFGAYGSLDLAARRGTMKYKIALIWLDHDWPSIALDCATLVIFGLATIELFKALFP